MNIRQATESDILQVARLLYQVQEVHAKGRPDLFNLGARKYTDEELKEIFSDAENRPVFVAETEGNVRGYAFCILEETSESHSLKGIKTLYIDDLCVDEECRRAGIGSMLYEFVLKFAKEKSCNRVTLNVWELNQGAKAFYEKKGMSPLKTVMEQKL